MTTDQMLKEMKEKYIARCFVCVCSSETVFPQVNQYFSLNQFSFRYLFPIIVVKPSSH